MNARGGGPRPSAGHLMAGLVRAGVVGDTVATMAWAHKPAVPVVSLTVVLPCRDEEANVDRVVGEALAAGSAVTPGVEVIVVDDGSRDGTGRIAAGLAAGDSRVRVVTHETSRGYGAALRSGFEAARGDWVFFTDGDGQFDAGEIGCLIALLGEHDGAIGYRERRRDGVVRRFNGWCWTRLTRLVLGIGARDVDCAFKVLPRRFLQECGLVSTGAMISAEMLARAAMAGLSLGEAGVTHRERAHGRQSGGDVRVIARAFRELWTLRRRLAAEGA